MRELEEQYEFAIRALTPVIREHVRKYKSASPEKKITAKLKITNDAGSVKNDAGTVKNGAVPKKNILNSDADKKDAAKSEVAFSNRKKSKSESDKKSMEIT